MVGDDFRLSPAARADLLEIWRFTADRWNDGQADQYVGHLAAMFAKLAEGSVKGRDVGHVRRGYRALAVEAHFIFYRRRKGFIEIIRILHKRMDLKSRLKDR